MIKNPPPHVTSVTTAIRRLNHQEGTPNGVLTETRAKVIQWARRFGLDADGHFEQTCCWSCAAYALPTASAHVVELAAELIGWLFVFDDVHGEADAPTAMMEVFDGCEHLLRTGRPPAGADRYQLALADLRQRLAGLVSDAWLGRFAVSMSQYFHGCLFELPYRRTDVVPSLDAYQYLRTSGIGVYPVFDLIELEYGEISPANFHRFAVLRATGAFLMAIVNDLHSYAKERDSLNIVTVLRARRRGDLLTALDDVVELYQTLLKRQADQIAQLTGSGTLTRNEKQVAYAVGEWVDGNYTWTWQCARYHADRIAAVIQR